MKTYEITVKRESYITYTIEAETEDLAHEDALAMGEDDYPGDADWSVSVCEVQP